MEDLISGLDENQLHFLLAIGENLDLLKTISEGLLKTEPHTLSTAETREKMSKALENYKPKKEQLISKIQQIAASSPNTRKIIEKKPIKVYMDGVFDIIHCGHFNAIRQAKALGDILIVGINIDSEVVRAKGPTIMNDEERIFLASACKWGDEIVGYTPYSPNIKLLDEVKADYCAHGDDIAFDENGKCVYDEIIEAGRMKYFKRSEGISTTDITGKLLYNILTDEEKKSENYKDFMEKYDKPVSSKFLFTSKRLASFSNNRVPKSTDKVVYFPGSFDLLGVGTIEALKKAKEAGDFLYLGIYSDELVNKLNPGKKYPFLNVNDRAFSALALKYVDEIVINPLYKISDDFLSTLKINIVFNAGKSEDNSDKLNVDGLGDPFEIPKKKGIYQYAQVEHEISNELFEERIKAYKDHYIKKFIKKTKNDEKSKSMSKIKVEEI